jgi:hypothetical protein
VLADGVARLVNAPMPASANTYEALVDSVVLHKTQLSSGSMGPLVP